jgi:hypothetical protein
MKSFLAMPLLVKPLHKHKKNYSQKHISRHTPHHFLTDPVVVVFANHYSSSLPPVVLIPYNSFT